MKIHTELTPNDLTAALDASGIPDVDVLCKEFNSRTHERRMDVHFDAEPGEGRRLSQHYHNGRQVIGLCWDEWAMFLNEVFLLDPSAEAGPYKGRDHFRWVTNGRFDDLAWEDRHPVHQWVSLHSDGSQCSGCGAIRFRPTA